MTQDVQAELIQLLPRLRSFARSLTGAPDQADDLVQAAVEKGLRNLSSFAPGTRLDAWMFRIIRNCWIDALRARRATVGLDVELEETLAGEDGRTTSEARLHLADVRRAMMGLPEDQRAVLMLVCVDGLRYREVAQVLEVPEGTVMSRLSRARLALVAALEERRPMTSSRGQPHDPT